MLTIYVVGNLLVEEDNIALKIMNRLQNEFPHVEFRELDPAENIPEEKELFLIDAAEGIESVLLLDDIDKIQRTQAYSLHDFDLGMTLKLMKKAGKLDKVKIICVPQRMEEQEAFEKVSDEIRKILA
jgi:Ni,Fe-hydrogenase maturation factor